MPLPFGMPDPKKQMKKLIDQEAAPMEMILREAIFNGFDANARLKHQRPDYDGDSYILISKDHKYPNKLRFTNVGGDFFSEENAINYFATIANSCIDNDDINKDYDKTKGRGGKISYLPHAPEGILYRSKKDEDNSIYFQAKLQREGYYGLSDFYCDDLEGKSNFPYCPKEDFSKELQNNIGTDMVLMGRTPKDDTWESISEACSPINKKTKSAGWSIVHYISNRLWGPPPCPVKVQIYHTNQDNEETYGKEKSHHYCLDLKSQMKKRKVNGTFKLPKIEGIDSNIEVYYAYLDKEDEGYYTSQGGFVGFAYKGEVYLEKKAPQSHRADLRNCGIFTKSSKWMLIPVMPDSANLTSSGDRTFLKGIDKNLIFEQIKENLPQEITDWLHDQIETEINHSDLKSWLKEQLSCFKFPFAPSLQGSIGGSKSNKANETEKNKNTVTGKKSKRQKIKENSQKLKTYEIPEISQFNDEESDLIRFCFDEYRIYYNRGHMISKFRAKKFINQFDKITIKEIENKISEYTIKSSLYRIFEVQQVHEDLSLQEKSLLWSPEILEAIWSNDTDSRIEYNLKRKDSVRSVA